MALENTLAQYQIEITRTGAGASQAVQDFQNTATAATTANAAMVNGSNASNVALTNLSGTSKGTLTAFKALQSTATAVGLTTFPQMTLAFHAAKDAMHAVRTSGVQMTAGLGLTAAALAGLTAIVMAGAEAWLLYADKQEEAASAKKFNEQTADFTKSLQARVQALRDAGKITNEEYRRLWDQLGGGAASNKAMANFLSVMDEGSASKSFSDLAILQANRAATQEYSDPQKFNSRAEQNARALRENVEMLELINQLKHDGMIVSEQADAAQIEADTKWKNRMIQIKGHLTEIQQIQERTLEMFASGSAHAFVEFISGTKSAKEAFREFASDFLKQVAEMILQAEILALLKAALRGTGFAGLSEGGMAFAARGGMFPTFAANGLSGVSSVSSPTYFPKFNVVAGEAGREMLTVLARPRMMEVGGMQAVVGNAGNNRLAITNADDLAGRGAGGRIVIEVRGTPDFEARIISNSVQGARVTVAQDLKQDSPISRGVKGLTA